MYSFEIIHSFIHSFTLWKLFHNSLIIDSYLLDITSKIIISDVDGTVTKEDVMGHVMYAIHQDYTQKGIVKMYNKLQVLCNHLCTP